MRLAAESVDSITETTEGMLIALNQVSTLSVVSGSEGQCFSGSRAINTSHPT